MVRFNRNQKLCECGCGEKPNPGRRFMKGHSSRVNNGGGHFIHKQGCRCASCKAKRGEMTGENHPLYGKSPTEATRKKTSKTLMGKPSPKTVKYPPRSDEAKRKTSESCKITLNLPEVKARMIASHIGLKDSEDAKKNKSVGGQRYWDNISPEEKEKRVLKSLSCNSPNKKEIKLQELLNELFPGEWKFVGNGEVILAGKSPDFININGQKKLIELFGDYWHRGQDPQDRIDVFKPYGWDTLVVWEGELKDLKGLSFKIDEFHRRPHA